jgi:hypothetical protein
MGKKGSQNILPGRDLIIIARMTPPIPYLHFVGVFFPKSKGVERNAFIRHHIRVDGGMTH